MAAASIPPIADNNLPTGALPVPSVRVPGGGASSRTKRASAESAWPPGCLPRLSAARRCSITCDRTRDKNATEQTQKRRPNYTGLREHWAVPRKRRRRSICPILCTRTTRPARSMNHRRRSFIYLYVVCPLARVGGKSAVRGAGHARLRETLLSRLATAPCV